MSQRSSLRVSALVALLALTLAIAGCAKKEEAKLTPKVTPPAVGVAGVLRAGIDTSTPPFAGVDGDQTAGIDVDVAAALADKLGLTVEFVEVTPSEAATALADGTVDVVLSVPAAGSDPTIVDSSATYISSAPAIFVSSDSSGSVEPSMTLETLPMSPIAAQLESEAYWAVEAEYGKDALQPYETLREALEALDRGQHVVAVGDALVSAYIARDFPRLRLAGQLAPATPLSVAVATENSTLAEAVRVALDEMAADGVLDSIRSKWVGELPELSEAEEKSEE